MSSWLSVLCVGRCWALFAVMVVVGSVNALWMAAITVVLSARAGRRGATTWDGRRRPRGDPSGVLVVSAFL